MALYPRRNKSSIKSLQKHQYAHVQLVYCVLKAYGESNVTKDEQVCGHLLISEG